MEAGRSAGRGTWTNYGTGFPSTPLTLCVSSFAYDGTNLFVGTQIYIAGVLYHGIGVYKSSNNGLTWTQCTGTPLTSYAVNMLKVYSGNLYAATEVSLWKSTDAGTTWTNIFSSISPFINSFDIDQSNGYLYAIDKNAGQCYLSDNGGLGWTAYNAGFTAVGNFAKSVYINNSHVYIGAFSVSGGLTCQISIDGSVSISNLTTAVNCFIAAINDLSAPVITAGCLSAMVSIYNFTCWTNFQQMSLDYDIFCEGADLDISKAIQYFLPFLFEFNCEVSKNFLANYTANPLGIINFVLSYKGNTIKLSGFLMSAKFNPGKATKTDLKLLCSPTVNLQNLIR